MQEIQGICNSHTVFLLQALDIFRDVNEESAEMVDEAAFSSLVLFLAGISKACGQAQYQSMDANAN